MNRFNQTLLKSIDDTLAAVLGTPYRDAIYIDLTTRFSMTKEQFPERLSILLHVLIENFGVTATNAISKAIAKELCAQLETEFADNTYVTLESYIKQLKQNVNQN